MATTPGRPALAREIGLFDATMLVMGGIVGSGIFMNPYVVARQVGTPFLVLAAWGFGGLVAVAGAFVYAELASLRPAGRRPVRVPARGVPPAGRIPLRLGAAARQPERRDGGRGGDVRPLPAASSGRCRCGDGTIAVAALALLTAVNLLGVRAGNDVQAVFMVLKIAAIAMLVVVGFAFFDGSRAALRPALDRPASFDLLTAFGAALVPVLFAYGGWQTSGFVMGELKRPERDMPRALLLGVAGVVVLYLSVNVVCLRVLGAAGPRRELGARLRRDAPRPRRPGRARSSPPGIVVSTLRLPRPGHPDRAARLLRDGAGRRLLRGGRPAEPAHARARAGDRAAGHAPPR